jgi:hypothetical protein
MIRPARTSRLTAPLAALFVLSTAPTSAAPRTSAPLATSDWGGTINFQLEERTDSSSSHTVDGRPSTSRRTETISETVRATLALGKAEATGTYTLTVVEQRSEASSCLGRANNRSNSRSSGPPRPLKSAHLPGR